MKDRYDEISYAACDRYVYDDYGWGQERNSTDKIFAFREGADWADRNPLSPWVSVKKDMPYDRAYKFVCSNDNGVPQCIGIAFYDGNENVWINDNGTVVINVDYWMDIPKFSKYDK